MKPTRTERINIARQEGLDKKPWPMLLLILRAYQEQWNGRGDDGSVVFARDQDRTAAMADLRKRLDYCDPKTMNGAILAWSRVWRAKWVGRSI